MRDVIVVVSVLAAGGCGGARDTSTLVALAGSQELTIDRLAEIVASSPDLPAAPETVESLAMRWVEYSLMAGRLADGDALVDSATVVAAAWPDVQAAIARSFRYIRGGTAAEPTPPQVDSTFRAGDVRLLKQILRRTTVDMPPAQREALRAEMVVIRNRLLGGGSWSEANAYNDDERGRPMDGSIGLVQRGQTVPAFETVAFALAPGQLSDVVETSVGFHLIHRPTLPEVAGEFTLGLNEIWAQRLDSSYQAELLVRRPIQMVGDVAASVREVVAAGLRPDADLSRRVLATYEGGEFAVVDLVHYVRILPPQFSLQVPAAPDEQLTNLVRSFVIRDLTALEATEAGAVLSASDYERILATYAVQLQRIHSATGVSAEAIAGLERSGLGPDEAAAQVVDAFLAQAAQSAGLRVTLPPGLSSYLLDEGDWDVFPAGISEVVARVEAARSAAQDSVR